MISLRSVLAFVALLNYSLGYACTKPTNIPPFQSSIYYQGIDDQVGLELKQLLHATIDQHRQYSYRCVWEVLQEADEDPTQPDNVLLLYTRRSTPKTNRDRGGADQNTWNREHLWAKSHGFPRRSQHAYTDAHHLYATDKSVNSSRGNLDFDDGGGTHAECTACRSDADSWEAPDAVKGDIARAMFYMAVRYEGEDGGTPDLTLVDHMTATREPRFGKLCTLLAWHQRDPISAEERRRNEVIYSWQGNRNPFIDNPIWAERIWGSTCDMNGGGGDGDEPVGTVKVTRYELGWDFTTHGGRLVLYFDEDAEVDSVELTDIQPDSLTAIAVILNSPQPVYFDVQSQRLWAREP